jgi:uncharacterized protein YkwD
MRVRPVALSASVVLLAACQSGWPDRPAGQAPPPQMPYPQSGYPQQGYPQGAYPQGAYPQGAYPPPTPTPPPAAPAPAPAADPLSSLGSGPPPPTFNLPSVPAGNLPWPLPGLPAPQPAPAPMSPQAPAPQGLSPSSLELANTINEYRASRGLPAVPISRSLTLVAETHVRDLDVSPPPSGCNAHSWSRNGAWTSCCYTPDHAQAECMWKKPAEVARFRGTGYEIAVTSYGGGLTSRSALESWKGSPAHHAVILNQDTWTNKTWRALGAGISNGHATAWFSDTADP